MPVPQTMTQSELEALVETLDPGRLPEGVRPLAVFDADETLWAGDIGEDLFMWFVEEHRVHPGVRRHVCDWLRQEEVYDGDDAQAGLEIFCDRYRDGDHHGIAGYEMMVWCMAGHLEAEVAAWARARTAAYLPSRIYRSQVRCIQRLEAKGIACYIVSASNVWSVQAAAELIGVPAVRTRAVELELEGDRLTDRLVRPTPIGPGKPEVIRRDLAGRPVLAMGDSVYDLPMLRSALYPVQVNPSRAALEGLTEEEARTWRQLKLRVTEAP